MLFPTHYRYLKMTQCKDVTSVLVQRMLLANEGFGSSLAISKHAHAPFSRPEVHNLGSTA